jgi:hypothetical protein
MKAVKKRYDDMASEKGLLGCMVAESRRREYLNNTKKNVNYNNVQRRRERHSPYSCICILRCAKADASPARV